MPNNKHKAKNMFFRALALCLALFFVAQPLQVSADGPWVSTWAYTVIDADSGQVLFTQNGDTAYDPASITKIMTLGLACEKAAGNWDISLTVSEEDVMSLNGTGSSHIALRPNEVISLRDALYAVMMVSANDAANTLASYLGGDIAGGVDLMNAKLEELGLVNSHFENPHGLDEANHKVTPNDMAQILSWAIKQEGFLELFTNRETYTMNPTNMQEVTRYFSLDDSQRIGSSQYYTPEILGAKTGYTDVSRYTYAALAEKDGMRLICVTMHSEQKTDRYIDVETILYHAFNNFQRVEIPPMGEAISFDIYGGGGKLGEGSATAEGASFLLFNGQGADTISLSHDVTEQYILGKTYTGKAVYVLPENENQAAATVFSEMQVSTIDAIVSANIGVNLPAMKEMGFASNDSSIFWPTLGVVSLLLFFLFVIFKIKQALRDNKRKRRQKMMRQQMKQSQRRNNRNNKDNINTW